MNKHKIVGIALGAAIAIAPFAASAASISDARFSNNQTSIDATGGATVSGTFTLSIGPGEVVEWFRLLPAGNPFTEQSVGGQLGYQEGVYTNVPFSVKVPPNTGTYNVDVQGAGIWGGNRSINGGDSVVLGVTSVGSVRVVAGTSGDTTTVGGDPSFSWTALTAFLEKWFASKTPAKPAYCAGLATFSTQVFGSVMAGGLQSFLISNGFSIPAGVTGYYGTQTLAAHTAAKASCN